MKFAEISILFALAILIQAISTQNIYYENRYPPSPGRRQNLFSVNRRIRGQQSNGNGNGNGNGNSETNARLQQQIQEPLMGQVKTSMKNGMNGLTNTMTNSIGNGMNRGINNGMTTGMTNRGSEMNEQSMEDMMNGRVNDERMRGLGNGMTRKMNGQNDISKPVQQSFDNEDDITDSVTTISPLNDMMDDQNQQMNEDSEAQTPSPALMNEQQPAVQQESTGNQNQDEYDEEDSVQDREDQIEQKGEERFFGQRTLEAGQMTNRGAMKSTMMNSKNGKRPNMMMNGNQASKDMMNRNGGQIMMTTQMSLFGGMNDSVKIRSNGNKMLNQMGNMNGMNSGMDNSRMNGMIGAVKTANGIMRMGRKGMPLNNVNAGSMGVGNANGVKTGANNGGLTNVGLMNGGSMNGASMNGGLMNGGLMNGGLMNGGLMNGGSMNGAAMNGGSMSGGLMNGGSMSGGLMNGGLMNGGLMNGGLMNGGLMNGVSMNGGSMNGGSGDSHDDGSYHDQSHQGNPIQWLRDAIRGEPGQDYPLLSEVPNTGFRCDDQQFPGYYADVESRCQVFHICQMDGRKDSFLCPNGTIFSQRNFVCVWWYDFDCDSAASLYSLNGNLFRDAEGNPITESNSGRTAGQQVSISSDMQSEAPINGQSQEEDFGTNVEDQVGGTTESPMAINGQGDLTETPMQTNIEDTEGQTTSLGSSKDSQSSTSEDSADAMMQKPIDSSTKGSTIGANNRSSATRFRSVFGERSVKKTRSFRRKSPRYQASTKRNRASGTRKAIRRVARVVRRRQNSRTRSNSRINRPLRYRNYERGN